MSEIRFLDSKGVSDTLLLALYARACETQRPDGLIHDERAVKIVAQLRLDGKRLTMHDGDQATMAMRLRKIDQITTGFLARHPQSAVVHIGCGLDTRFDRVDNGLVEWFDIDLPDVIALREKLLEVSNPRYHPCGCSILEDGWLAAVRAYNRLPLLFIAEGVLTYFTELEVRRLVATIQSEFPGAELAFDASTPFLIRMDNLHLLFYHQRARLHWGLKHGQDLESWAPGIRLLEEWYYFDRYEPRLKAFNWIGRIPGWAKMAGIFHLRLGAADGSDGPR